MDIKKIINIMNSLYAQNLINYKNGPISKIKYIKNKRSKVEVVVIYNTLHNTAGCCIWKLLRE